MCRSKRLRACRGYSLIEFAVAFAVLLMLVFFPMISLSGLASVYVAGQTLNEAQLHEAALIDHRLAEANLGVVKAQIPETWYQSGLGRYAGTVGRVRTKVTYKPTGVDKYGVIQTWVIVSTTLTLSPYLNVSYFPQRIPGLNESFDVTFVSEKLMEDPTNAPPRRVQGGE